MRTNLLRVVVPALLAVPLFLSAEPRGTRIAFGPEAGAKVRKTIELTSQAHLESAKMAINGETRDVGEIEQTFNSTEKYVFLDEYRKVEKGELQALARTYEEAADTQKTAMKTPRGEQNRDAEAKTELMGKTVAFELDASTDEWSRKYVGDEGADELLAGLEPMYEMLAFVPAHEVGDGDQWELGKEAIDALLFPGGELGMLRDDDTAAEIASRKAMRDAFDAKGKATFKGLRSEDGVSLAVIGFEAEGGAEWEPESESGATETRAVSIKLKGELLWNLDKRRAQHVEVEHEGSYEMHTKKTMSRGEESFEISSDTVLAVTGKGEYAFETAE